MLAGKGKISRDDLLYFKRTNEGLIKQFGYWLTGITSNTLLPTQMLNKKVTSRVLLFLAAQVGRIQLLVNLLPKRETLVLSELCPYITMYDSATGLAVAVKHLTGDVVNVPLGFRWDNSWKLESFLTDAEAQVSCALGQHKLMVFFSAGVGPYKIMVDHMAGDYLEKLATRFSHQIDMQTEQVEKGSIAVVPDTFVSPDKLEQKRQALERAREAAKSKKARLSVAIAGDAPGDEKPRDGDGAAGTAAAGASASAFATEGV